MTAQPVILPEERRDGMSPSPTVILSEAKNLLVAQGDIELECNYSRTEQLLSVYFYYAETTKANLLLIYREDWPSIYHTLSPPPLASPCCETRTMPHQGTLDARTCSGYPFRAYWIPELVGAALFGGSEPPRQVGDSPPQNVSHQKLAIVCDESNDGE